MRAPGAGHRRTLEGRSIADILGPPDDIKFRSCLTLFEAAAPEPGIFAEALRKYFDGVRDARTLQLLRLRATEGPDS